MKRRSLSCAMRKSLVAAVSSIASSIASPAPYPPRDARAMLPRERARPRVARAGRNASTWFPARLWRGAARCRHDIAALGQCGTRDVTADVPARAGDNNVFHSAPLGPAAQSRTFDPARLRPNTTYLVSRNDKPTAAMSEQIFAGTGAAMTCSAPASSSDDIGMFSSSTMNSARLRSACPIAGARRT